MVRRGINERQLPFGRLRLFPMFAESALLLTISKDFAPVGKIAIDLDSGSEIYRNTRKIHDVEILMHTIADEPRYTKLDGLRSDETARPEIRTSFRVGSRRRNDVVAQPRILMNIG